MTKKHFVLERRTILRGREIRGMKSYISLGIALGWGLPMVGAQSSDELILVAGRSVYQEYCLQFPSPEPSGCETNDTVRGSYFAPAGTGPFPGVLVLHSMGTENAALERRFCRKLVRQGIASLLLWWPYHGPRAPAGRVSGAGMFSSDFEQATRAFHQAVADARAGVDWLAARPEIRTERLGIAGLSLGSVLASTVLGQDDRLQVALLVLGGGDMVKLYQKSFLLGGLRLAWKDQGLTPEHLREKWKDFEPLNFAPAARDRTILMINGRYDSVVPQDCSRALWEALGQPPRIRLNAGHFGGLLFRKRLLGPALNFLTEAMHGRTVSLPKLQRAARFPAPKLWLVRLDPDKTRPGVALEMQWFDAHQNLSADLGWVPGRLCVGVGFDVVRVGGSPVVDVGIGYAFSRQGRGDSYLSLALHF